MPFDKSDERDWDRIKVLAKSGELDAIPSDVYIRNYNALRRIATDNLQALAMEREVFVYWGRTGTGKSRKAWSEAGLDAYPKGMLFLLTLDPNSKFWDGYRGHGHVVIDEFRGSISISHVLRWFDRYPVIVEVKGSSVCFTATSIWITSNLDPRLWYPDADEETRDALLRRLNITHFL